MTFNRLVQRMKVTKAQSHIGATEAKSIEVFLPDSLALNNLEICLLARCCVQYTPEVGLGTLYLSLGSPGSSGIQAPAVLGRYLGNGPIKGVRAGSRGGAATRSALQQGPCVDQDIPRACFVSRLRAILCGEGFEFRIVLFASRE